MAYDARAVANFFLDLAKSEGRSLDPLGIQKFIYFSHGWYLAINGTPLIKQPIEAWDYGPVVHDVYHEFREYGSNWIKRHAKRLEYNPATGAYKTVRPVIGDSEKSSIARGVLNRVWSVYKGFSSIQLSNMTHEPDSPWTLARRERLKVIPDESIQKYFTAKARQHAAGR